MRTLLVVCVEVIACALARAFSFLIRLAHRLCRFVGGHRDPDSR